MFKRIGSVIICVLSAVWLARQPDWEPVIALVASVIGYAGVEFIQYRETKKNRGERDALVEQRDASVAREAFLGAECQRRQAIIDKFVSEHNEREKKSLDDAIVKLGKIARGES